MHHGWCTTGAWATPRQRTWGGGQFLPAEKMELEITLKDERDVNKSKWMRMVGLKKATIEEL